MARQLFGVNPQTPIFGFVQRILQSFFVKSHFQVGGQLRRHINYTIVIGLPSLAILVPATTPPTSLARCVHGHEQRGRTLSTKRRKSSVGVTAGVALEKMSASVFDGLDQRLESRFRR